jgi:hypothetical protein
MRFSLSLGRGDPAALATPGPGTTPEPAPKEPASQEPTP